MRKQERNRPATAAKYLQPPMWALLWSFMEQPGEKTEDNRKEGEGKGGTGRAIGPPSHSCFPRKVRVRTVGCCLHPIARNLSLFPPLLFHCLLFCSPSKVERSMSASPLSVAGSSERPLRRLPLPARARLIGPFFLYVGTGEHLSAQANVPVCER